MHHHHSTVRHASHTTHHFINRHPMPHAAQCDEPDCTSSLDANKKKKGRRGVGDGWRSAANSAPGTLWAYSVSAEAEPRGTHVDATLQQKPLPAPIASKGRSAASVAWSRSRACLEILQQLAAAEEALIASATPYWSITSRRACPTGLHRASPSRARGWQSSSTFSTAAQSSRGSRKTGGSSLQTTVLLISPDGRRIRPYPRTERPSHVRLPNNQPAGRSARWSTERCLVG